MFLGPTVSSCQLAPYGDKPRSSEKVAAQIVCIVRVDSNHRFLDVGQESSPLDHGTVFISMDPPRVALGFSACGADVFLLDDEPVLKARRKR